MHGGLWDQIKEGDLGSIRKVKAHRCRGAVNKTNPQDSMIFMCNDLADSFATKAVWESYERGYGGVGNM